MKKLESDGSDVPGDDLDPEASAADVSAIGENDPEAVPDTGRFSVYLNKKLTVEPLPDYYFIQPETGGDDKSDSGKKKNSGDSCEDKCHKKCPFSDYECVWSCIANCSR